METATLEQVQEPKVKAEPKAPKAKTPEQIVCEACPSIRGLDRKIKALWVKDEVAFFRVNYHNWKEQNAIIESAFVKVTQGQAHVQKEIKTLTEDDWRKRA